MIMFSFGFAETLEIYYNSNAHIYGFQFNVDSVIVKSAYGGAGNEFTLSTGNNTVLGFSMTGRTIPPGNYTIMYLDFSGDISTICLSYIIVSDPNGNAIDYEIGECWIP